MSTMTESMNTSKTAKKVNVRNLVQIAMLGAVATVLMLFEFPLPFLAPSFYELDFSEVPVLIGAFSMGPVAGILIELIKILMNLFMNGTDTAFVGEIANFLMGCALVVPAGIIYKRKKNRNNALIGMVVGIAALALVSSVLNGAVLLPVYAKAFGMPLDVIVQAGAAIIPAIDSVMTFCLFCVVPFNVLKGIFVAIITFLLYKRISWILKGHHA